MPGQIYFSFSLPLPESKARLLRFAVRLMLTATRAELLEFQALRCRFLVLRIRVIPFLAFSALERDNFPRHPFESFLLLSARSWRRLQPASHEISR
jgi:hypothetical protein